MSVIEIVTIVVLGLCKYMGYSNYEEFVEKNVLVEVLKNDEEIITLPKKFGIIGEKIEISIKNR